MASGSCTSRTTFSRSTLPPMAFCRARSCLRFIAAMERLAAAFAARQRLVQRQLAGTAAVIARPSPRLPRVVRAPAPVLRGRCGRSRSACRTRDIGWFVRRRCCSASLRLPLPALLALVFLGLGLERSLRARALRVPWLLSRRGGARDLRRVHALRLRAASASSLSRALAACTAFRRRSISASVIPAGRFDGSPSRRLAGRGGCGTGLGHHNALALGFHHDVLGPPVAEALLHVARTCTAPRRPNVFLPSVSLMKLVYPFGWPLPPSFSRTP